MKDQPSVKGTRQGLWMRWYEAGSKEAGGPDGREQGRRRIPGRGKILCRSLEMIESHSSGPSGYQIMRWRLFSRKNYKEFSSAMSYHG